MRKFRASGELSSLPMIELSQSDSAHFSENLNCQSACPAHTDIGGFVNLVSQGRFDEAYLLNRKAHIFPGILGRICARPCEKACRSQMVDGNPVSICNLQRSSADLLSTPMLPDRPAVSRTQRVAVVGAGPSGLACARDLRQAGYPVTVYDALPHPGGMLTGGIPAWRLPRSVIKTEVDRYMEALGVKFCLNTRVGRDIPLEKLLAENAAVFLAAGCQQPVRLDIPGQDLAGFEYGLHWLKKLNLEQVKPDLTGKGVVVIGAGYSAMDCGRSALRLGARAVTLCYRRTRQQAPLEESEFVEGEKEGLKYMFLVSPVAALGDAQGNLTGLRLERNIPGENHAKTPPITIPGSEFVVDCDMVLVATGQASDHSWLPGDIQLAVQQTGHVPVDPVTGKTAWSGLFAGGDFTQGSRNVISAIADGRISALQIHAYLSGEQLPASFGYMEPVKYPKRDLRILRSQPQLAPCLEPSRRLLPGGNATPMEREVELGYNSNQAKREAERCLRCFYNVTLNPALCRHCRTCIEHCPQHALQMVPLNENEEAPGSWHHRGHLRNRRAMTIEVDENLCIRCGQCVAECPTGALRMTRFHYHDSARLWSTGQDSGQVVGDS